ncbi:MAG: hypothetical protein RLZZ387_407 [Chloroflexota bacterium]|jgi:UDP-2,3-diacylglucosamine pyrophosphatase LpxH
MALRALPALAARLGRSWRTRLEQSWRTRLCPTDNTTPTIQGDDVRPGIRRLIVSDLHLGAGDRLEEFTADAEMAAFVRSSACAGDPTELILGGDTFEFLQSLPEGIADDDWSPEAAVLRLDLILRAHAPVIDALREFVALPDRQLTVIIGNHDFELHYQAAKRHLRATLGLEEGDERLRFGVCYEGDGIYFVHGNQFDTWNRFIYFDGICEPFEVVRGTRMVKDVINQLKAEPLPIAPLMDNVKPISAFVWYLLSLPRLRNPAVRSFVVRGLLMVARSMARTRRYARPAIPATQRAPRIPWRQLRRRGARGLAQLRSAAKRVVRSGAEGEDAVAQIEREASQQLQREIRAFRGDVLRAVAKIACSPEHSHNRLFVCGHTHLAQVVKLGAGQTYINTGTWTDVVLDVASGQRQEERFPFLEVTYAGHAPQGRLLVWRSEAEDPAPWAGEHAAIS